ncbi:hypothetical protein COUCH_34070 [Couchioplanes caeruleus]|uniref:hypothetical protein n=1 Tax=Couchioplanes caeruleus TaxID=56438 RepID=UPI0020C0F63A|nr:hypothetical protein [Couchioplanes caeruleus]UQU63951.1 hypothetical protein COUCH_34070 [Couchioplanes caeruleus]
MSSAWDPDSPDFLAAQHRAAVRDRVLSGTYVLVDGELLRRAHGSGPVAPERVELTVSFTTTARHRDGAVLELTAPDGDGVRAIWWRGLNNDAAETIPAGFGWEKNDDYHYGTVGWAELDDMAVSAELRPR